MDHVRDHLPFRLIPMYAVLLARLAAAAALCRCVFQGLHTWVHIRMVFILPRPVLGLCVHFEPYRSAAYKAEFTLPGCCIDNDLHCGLACSVPGHVSCPRSFFFLFLFMPCVGAPGACWSPFNTWLTVGYIGTRQVPFTLDHCLQLMSRPFTSSIYRRPYLGQVLLWFLDMSHARDGIV